MTPTPRFLSAADSALVVEFGSETSVDVNARVLALDAALARTPPPGLIETLPTLRSLLIEYDPLRTSQRRLRATVQRLVDTLDAAGTATSVPRRVWPLPVLYGGAAGPDLDAVAAACAMRPEEVIAAHAGTLHLVAMIGNLPGLPYLLGLPDTLRIARRDDPRPSVPAGSVAIAAGMSCVYPVAGPGGWHLIGRTPVPLFEPAAPRPVLVAPGDAVRFRPVDAGRFDEVVDAVVRGWRPGPEPLGGGA